MTNRGFKNGASREQPSLLPARIEDYVAADNPVRAIDSFVGALDLAKLGFRHANRGVEMGQPPYDPADLLKLYLYGYTNQIRSSRRLQREASRNLELIWLLKNLKPGYRTIANFRKENWAALKAANRSFVLLLRELDLIGGTLVAVDGALFHGNASKDSIFTRGKLAKQIAKLDQEIEAYGKSLDTNDVAEAKQPANGSGNGNESGGGDVGDKMKELMARRERALADLKELESGDKGQVSKTDSDARLLSKGDQTIAGYNVQSVVDDKHKLIVASEVVNRSDAGHTRWQKRPRRFSKPRPCRYWPMPAIITVRISRPARMTASRPTCRRTKATVSSRRKAASPARTSAMMLQPIPTAVRPASCCIPQRSPG